MYKKIMGFTLAETLIVLVILGIIASITIPAVIRNQIEAQNRTRIKKTMTVYDTALNKMVIENGIKSDTALVNWADSNTKNDCANTSAYFKVSRNLEVNGNETHCKFRNPDGVFWDISDIKKPLVALREQDLNDATAQSDTNRAFYMFGWFDEQGSLRSNDMGKISATDKATLEKLYDFIAGKTKTSLEEVKNIDDSYMTYINTYLTLKENISIDCTGNNSLMWKNCKDHEFYYVGNGTYYRVNTYGDVNTFEYWSDEGTFSMSGCDKTFEECSHCGSDNADICKKYGYTKCDGSFYGYFNSDFNYTCVKQ